MFGGDGANERVMLLESGGADPFVEGVERIARSHREINQARHSGEQQADDQLEKESGHSVATRARKSFVGK
jgi:hypothetical protein